MTVGLLAVLASAAFAQSPSRPSMLVPVVRRAGSPSYARKPTAAETEYMARDIEKRLAELDERLKEENAAFDRASLELAGARLLLEFEPPESPRNQEAKRKLAGILETYPKAPLFLEMTILARRLQVYRETGELPADIPDKDAIRRLLEDPWGQAGLGDPTSDTTRVFALETDILKLEKQIARYARLMEPKLAEAPAQPAARALPPAAAAPGRPAASPQPALELGRDAGRGRQDVDPIPPLLAQLVSPDARQRALAADELAQHGARVAVVPLTSALGDPDAKARASAALALGALGPVPAETLAALEAALQDKSEDVRFSARSALQRLK